MIKYILVLLCLLAVTHTKKASLERVLKDIQFGKFITNECNYSYFLDNADYSAEKIVPFQDTSNDTFFRVGIIHKTQLENYTSINMGEQLGDIKNKPWLPLLHIKEELANCLQYKYGSLSDNDFKYDKGLYGWFNIMKFSCAEISEGFYTYAMAFSRTRFRLKQVYLRRQNKYWATSGRSIITRDLQKIVEIFSIQYAKFVTEKLFDEQQVLTGSGISKKKEREWSNLFMKLPDSANKELKDFFPPNLKHTAAAASRGHTFNTIAVPVKSRIIVTRTSSIGSVVENLSSELSDDACETLDSCSKVTCTYNSRLNDTFNKKADTHNYSREKAIFTQLAGTDSLIAYQVSKPYFKFETMKRKTAQGIVDVKQQMDDDAKRLWEAVVEQQMALGMRMHSQQMFQPVRSTEDKDGPTTTRAPYSSQEYVDSQLWIEV